MVEEQPGATITVCQGGTKARSVQDRGEVNRPKTVCSISGRGRGATIAGGTAACMTVMRRGDEEMLRVRNEENRVRKHLPVTTATAATARVTSGAASVAT